MKRATCWTVDVENAFRFQAAGWRDAAEYLSQNDCVEVWDAPASPFVRVLKTKKSGLFMYFRATRECEDRLDIFFLELFRENRGRAPCGSTLSRAGQVAREAGTT